MCGIAGTINIPLTEEVLQSISHRGPDDFGLFTEKVAGATVMLGHRRLSIVDLSPAGHQPMKSIYGQIEAVFNGEIYNHASLRPRLNGVAFRGHSDTETLVNYIEKFGIESVADLNGIFAFGLLDRKNNSLYLVRDRYGVKPMYYLQRGDQFVFSSEIRLIRRLFNLSISKENLALLLKLRYCPSPNTLFSEVKKVRPGHVLKYDLNTRKVTEYPYVKSVSTNTSITMPEALEQYGHLFENAVKRQLMSDVDVGLLLSGGLDSALVGFYAQKHYAKKIQSFTVGFEEDTETNELAEAKATAAFIGTEHHEVVISSSHFEEIFRKCISIIEEPLGTTSVIPMYYLNQDVSRHVKVVLTGQGADEPLGGYRRYQAELWRKRIPSPAFPLLKMLSSMATNEALVRGANSVIEPDVVTRFDKTYALFTDSEINKMLGYNNRRSLEQIRYFYDLLNGDSREAVESMMSVDMRMNLADDLLLYTDKVSMNFSIEARVPLLDNDLAGFIESLPYSFRLGIGKGKLIHKKFADKVLPGEIVHRKKKGFYSPTEAWFRGKTGARLREALCDQKSKLGAYLDLSSVDQVFTDHIKRGINREKQLFMLISLYYWLEDFS